jgi:hypothetical protein
MTDEQKLKEIEREVAMRRNVYPRWITAGKISEHTANFRIAVLESVAGDYRAKIEAAKNQINLFG